VAKRDSPLASGAKESKLKLLSDEVFRPMKCSDGPSIGLVPTWVQAAFLLRKKPGKKAFRPRTKRKGFAKSKKPGNPTPRIMFICAGGSPYLV